MIFKKKMKLMVLDAEKEINEWLEPVRTCNKT